jgi:hypothetical protein
MRRVKTLGVKGSKYLYVNRLDLRHALSVVRAVEKAVDESRSMGFVYSATQVAITEALDRFNKPRKQR